jgi:hypothetical protein
MSFKKDNRVRMITDEGNAQVMCVVEDSNELTGTTECMMNATFDTNDLELISEAIRGRKNKSDDRFSWIWSEEDHCYHPYIKG